MNATRFTELLDHYFSLQEDGCLECVCREYCAKVNEEEGIPWEDFDCHGMMEGWLNS